MKKKTEKKIRIALYLLIFMASISILFHDVKFPNDTSVDNVAMFFVALISSMRGFLIAYLDAFFSDYGVG